MSIGSVGSSNNPIVNALQSVGLSSDKIGIVEEDLEQAQQASGITAGQGVDVAAVRKALDTQIAEDVKSGDLSEEDAAKITKALDQMEGKTDATAESGAAKGAGGGRPAGGGGGGGGGSAEKTELSRTETVAGGIKTTVITYTDGTTETKTTAVSEPDTKTAAGAVKADEKSATEDDRAAQDYLAKIEPGTLFDAYA